MQVTGIPAPQSPMDNLLSRFTDQNESFNNLIGRLTTVGHKLSDTNRPTAEPNQNKEPAPTLPFENGNLMALYTHLSVEDTQIQRLREQVEKLESLI